MSFLRRVKPSYLVLLAFVPFFFYLYINNQTYQEALLFILPGLQFTIFVTLSSYLFASLWGLCLAGMQLLKYEPKILLRYAIAVLVLALLSLFSFTRAPETYVLYGDASSEGRVAIVKGTPKRLIDIIKVGDYSPDAEAREFRSVTDTAAAFDRLERGVVTAAFIPLAELPADANILWETLFLANQWRNPAVFFLALSLFLLVLVLASWYGQEHPLAIFADLYVDVIRGVPMLLIIIFFGFVLPGAMQDVIGFSIEPHNDFLKLLLRGTWAVAIGYSAYMAEIFRAGIEAVPRGQIEASRSLGLSGLQTARFVILPQAIRIVLPPLGNELIAMTKDTALLSVIGMPDVLRKGRELAADTLNPFPPYNTAAVIYVIITLGASSFMSWLEKRSRNKER